MNWTISEEKVAVLRYIFPNYFFKPFPKQAQGFTCLQYKTFENTGGKGEIAPDEQFLLFPQCFLPIWRTFCHSHQMLNYRLQTLSAWNSLKFVVWERVKQQFQIPLAIETSNALSFSHYWIYKN